MTKQELRKHYLQKRSALSAAEIDSLSGQLCTNFFSAVDLAAIKVLHLFLPIKKFNEPNTWLMVDRLKKNYPQVKLSIPRVNAATGGLEHVYLDEQLLQLSNWEIPEQRRGIETKTPHIDMVLVPMLIFDQQGQRVGYGKGFYDRFLAACAPSCKKIGLCFFPPVEKIETNEHDQALDVVITPERVYSFERSKPVEPDH